MAFNLFPFTNLHNLNTDWILKTIKELKEAAETAAAQVTSALSNAVLYTLQTHNETDRKQACANIHAVSYDDAPLNSGNAAQARANIGAASASDIPDVSGFVSYSVQSPTTGQKTIARDNIDAASAADLTDLGLTVAAQSQALNDCVKYTAQTGRTDAEKAQARNNIGAISAAEIPPAASAVLYTRQSLNDVQKGIARDNIEAEHFQLKIQIDNPSENVYTTTTDYDNMLGFITAQDGVVWVSLIPYGETLEYRGFAKLAEDDNGIVADLFNALNGPGQAAPTIWYHVYWREVSDVPTLSVAKLEGRMVPNSSISDSGKYLIINNLGLPQWRPSPAVVSDTQSTSITLSLPVTDTVYEYGELTALTVTAITNPGEFIISWRSGSTPTTHNFPSTMRFPTADNAMEACEANTDYEVNCRNGKCMVTAWPVVSP